MPPGNKSMENDPNSASKTEETVMRDTTHPLLPTNIPAKTGKTNMVVQAHSSNLKLISLVVLIAQTTALVLVLRYSKTEKQPGEVTYISSTAILMAEIVKYFTCIVVLLHLQGYKVNMFKAELKRDIFMKKMDTLKVAVPAVVYVIQNNLLFLALSKLDAATYQVTYQLKILTTALFSVFILRRSLNMYKWVALVLLTAGVALVQLPSDSKPSSVHGSGDNFIGLLCVLVACFLSGFAGVYFEKILKTSPVSLWMRNLQLAFFSIFGAFFMCYVSDYDKISEGGFFQGYNKITIFVILLQAYGGLVIALVVKYADNILKGFATSLSIIISSFMSWLLLGDFSPSFTFAMGALLVIGSTFLYGYEPKTPTPHTA